MLQHQVRWALKMLWPGLYVSCVQLFPHPSRNPLLQATLIWGLVNSNFAIWEIPERQVLIALSTINAWTGGQMSTLFVWASQFNQNAKPHKGHAALAWEPFWQRAIWKLRVANLPQQCKDLAILNELMDYLLLNMAFPEV
jgi:hypothetical protein